MLENITSEQFQWWMVTSFYQQNLTVVLSHKRWDET